MRRRTLPAILLVSFLAAAAFPGCARRSMPVHRTPAGKPAGKPPAPSPAVTPPAKTPPVPVADNLFAEGMTALQDGGHEQALERFSAAWQEKPGHVGVAREFDGALLALKKNGDAAYAQGKWEAAGKRWTGTLRFITHPAANWRTYPFTRSEVRAKVDHLTSMLMEKALTEYRKGAIQAAIAGWRAVLSYDPSHDEANRSLRTASKQLETLKNLPPGK